MLLLDEFKPVTLADKEFFASHYAKYPQTHSDNTFTNMVCWNHYAHYRYAYVRGNIILSSNVDGVTRFRAPIGPRDPELLKDLISLSFKVSDSQPILLIDPATAEWMRSVDPTLDIVQDRNEFEYMYLAKDLAELPGGNYVYIRRQLHRFLRDHTHTIEPVSVENGDETKLFLERWCEWRKCEDDLVLYNEKEAMNFAIDHFKELGLSGIIVRVDGKIGAMSLFEPLNTNTALIHFEKGLTESGDGIYKVVNEEVAKVLARNFEYINRESDLGIAGLREAKMRYHPHHMIEVYSVKKH